MTNRFALRPDPAGFSVVDTWSGEPAVIAMVAQKGLSEVDADHTAALLNQRHAGEPARPAAAIATAVSP